MRKILGLWLAAVLALAGALIGAAPAQAAVPIKGMPSLAAAQAGPAARLLTTSFFYNVARQSFSAGQSTDGVGASIHVRKPVIHTANHSLVELSAQRGGNIVEIGWTVDPSVNGGSSDPHLFVYHWVNGVGQGYNTGCTDNAANPVNAGSSLIGDITQQNQFTIQVVSGNWWLSYKGTQVCYFPASKWTSPTFPNADLVQGFGEVATSSSAPCDDMGNGLAASARIGSLSIYNPVPSTILPNFTMSEQPVTPVGVYDISILSNRTMALGGPGWTGAGGTPGNTGSC